MRFREDKPGDLERARTAVAEWRAQNPASSADQLNAALGSQFPSDYGPVLRAVLFTLDRGPRRQHHTAQAMNTRDALTGSATAPPGTLTELRPCRRAARL